MDCTPIGVQLIIERIKLHAILFYSFLAGVESEKAIHELLWLLIADNFLIGQFVFKYIDILSNITVLRLEYSYQYKKEF